MSAAVYPLTESAAPFAVSTGLIIAAALLPSLIVNGPASSGFLLLPAFSQPLRKASLFRTP